MTNHQFKYLAVVATLFLSLLSSGTTIHAADANFMFVEISPFQQNPGCVKYAARVQSDKKGVLRVVDGVKIRLPDYTDFLKFDLTHHRLLAFVSDGTQGDSFKIAQFGFGQDGRLRALHPLFLPVLDASDAEFSGDAHYLFVSRPDCSSIDTFLVSSKGDIRVVSTTKIPGGGGVSDSGHPTGGGGPSISMLRFERSTNCLYFATGGAGNANFEVYQFAVEKSGHLKTLDPPFLDANPCTECMVDERHKVLYSWLNNLSSEPNAPFGMFAFSSGALHRLVFPISSLPPPGPLSSTTPTDDTEAADGSDDLLPIFPQPPLPSPSLSVTSLRLDTDRNLLFGFGGDAANEIDVWHTSRLGVAPGVKRYWIEPNGFIQGSDPQAHFYGSDQEPKWRVIRGSVDATDNYLYVEQFELGGRERASIYCFKIMSDGELTILTSNALPDIKTDNLAYVELYIGTSTER